MTNLDDELSRKPALYAEFYQTFTEEFHRYLDRGLGRCLLRNDSAASIIADTLRHFDGSRYLLGDFVVMPNHVHVLVCLRGSTTMTGLCKSWKRFSAGKINRLINAKGRFWHEEAFDHLVRTEAQFRYFRRYIATNPDTAGLQTGNYLLWQRPI